MTEQVSNTVHDTSSTVFDVRRVKIGRRPNTAVERLVYSTLIAIFDTLDVVLCWAHPLNKKLEDRPIESDQWDDAEILRRIEDPENMPLESAVRRIGNHTFVKATYVVTPRLEGAAFELARTRTKIPIPRILRTIEDEEGNTFIVMDYIPGERLDHAWPTLSLWSKLWVAFTLRRYIRQLRQVNSSVPGPVADSPQFCDTYLFGEKRCGPFPDYASLSAFYNRKRDITIRVSKSRVDGGNRIRRAPPDIEPFDDSRPLVFNHGDLSMRNIILGRDGRIWLVDWGLSGFYPPWFEYVSMVYTAESDGAPDSWNRLIPFIADPLFKHMKWMDRIGAALRTYRDK